TFSVQTLRNRAQAQVKIRSLMLYPVELRARLKFRTTGLLSPLCLGPAPAAAEKLSRRTVPPPRRLAGTVLLPVARLAAIDRANSATRHRRHRARREIRRPRRERDGQGLVAGSGHGLLALIQG